jgi:hypothetical protein
MPGWEFHAYLVKKGPTGCSIYEPEDKVTKTLSVGVFGIQQVKEAYRLYITPKKVKAARKGRMDDSM